MNSFSVIIISHIHVLISVLEARAGNIIRKRLIIINNLQFITGNFYKENIDRCLTQEINTMSFEFETTPHIRLNVVQYRHYESGLISIFKPIKLIFFS